VTSLVPSARAHIDALRAARDHLASLVSGLDADAISAPSYDTEWSIGQVLSHLGSQAVIFDLFLEAGLSGQPAPGGEVFAPIWDVWNAKDAIAWRDDYLDASEREVATFEAIDDAALEAFSISMFGLETDIVALLRMRLGESAAHAWDVAVMSDPSATVEPAAVELLVDHLGRTAARGGKPQGETFRVRVGTTDPQRDLVVSVGESVGIAAAEADDSYDGSVDLPAEAFFRLVYGRLDPDHAPTVAESGARGLADLRAVFPGF
jgi:uncharacterized protein (TIGR03083 family)